MKRRSLLALAAACVGGLSGCSALDVDGLAGAEASTTERGREATATPRPTPDLPYSAPTDEGNVASARGIEVHNRRATTAYVTLVVEDGDRTVYVDSRTLRPGETAVHDALVRREGVYRVLLETADGARTVHGWAVGEDWLGSRLTARVTAAGIDTRQVAICNPDCPPIAASGEAVDLPREDNTDPGREVTGALGIRNDRAETTPVDVAVERAGRTLVDYRYRLPAGVTILVPVARQHGSYDLSVRAAGERLATSWHLPEETYPNLRVGEDGPAVECDRDRLRVTAVRNDTDRGRRVGLRLRADGRTAVDRTVTVPANGFVDRLDLTARGDTTAVEVEVGDRSLTANWTLCPPEDIQVLVLDDFLFLRSGGRVLVSNAPGEGG